MEIRVGNLISRLITDNPAILSDFSKKYSFTVPGYQYSTAYKKGYWDGKKSYFKKDGSFRTGLLDRILSDLKLIGCDNLIIDKPKLSKIELKKVKNFKYREYQETAISHCLDATRCLVNSPTGSGKTLIMAGIIKSLQDHYGKDAVGVILFKEKGILKQTYDFFKSCGIKDLGINFGEGFIHGNIMLSTVQSIDKILDTHLDLSILLMVDEVHQFGSGDTTIAAIESFPNAVYRFGFTATIPSEKADTIHSRYVLEGAFGPVYTTKSMNELIDEKSLSKPIIQIIDSEIKRNNFNKLSYQEVYEEYIVYNADRNNKINKIVEQIYSANKDARVLILVKNLDHVRNLEQIIDNVFVLEGINNMVERYDTINKFITSDRSSTLVGTNVLQTGISIDDITHMINARGLKGEIPTIQGLGRGVRKTKKSDVLYYYDFIDDIDYLDKHSKERIKHYKELGLEISYVRI